MLRPLLLLLPLLLVRAAAQSSTDSTGSTPLPSPTPSAAEYLAKVRPFAQILDRALAGYAAGDSAVFWADASSSATPPATAKTFQRLYLGYYQAEFGKILSKKLIAADTQLDPNLGVLVYEAACEKRPKVRLSANFRREHGELKIVQVRFEKL